jgi:ElaA protein
VHALLNTSRNVELSFIQIFIFRKKVTNLSSPPQCAIEWRWSSFAQLSAHDVYAILALRQDVFVLEQECLFRDIDDIDQQSTHLLGWQLRDGQRTLVAYLRYVPAGIVYREASLGRVACARAARGRGLGRQLFAEGVRHADQQHPAEGLRISAQQYLETFYAGFGFTASSAPYLEDDIWHVDMLRPAAG